MTRVLLVVLLVAMIALADQSKPVTPVCNGVRGGQTLTATGTRAWRAVGETIHDLRQVGKDEVTYADAEKYGRALWDGVLKLWWLSVRDAAANDKVDPLILEKEREAEQEQAEAEKQCALDAKELAECTPGGESGAEEPWDPKTASISVGRTAEFSAEQRTNAAVVIKVAKSLGLPERVTKDAAAVGLVTILVESEGRNVAYGDRDSLGLFQQRAAWGPKADRMNPVKSAGMFYKGGRGGQDGLTDKNWLPMSIGEAAQAVQVSAFPDRYAQRESDARQLIAELWDMRATDPGTPPPSSDEPPEVQCVAPEGSPENPNGTIQMAGVAGMYKVKDPASGITYNVPKPKNRQRQKAMEFAFAQLGEPYVFGSQGPNSWDCSGLTHKAWAAAGESVYPQTETLVREERRVAKPQPGDLIYHFGHVQMFMGNIGGEQIILEAPRTGLTVRIVKQWYTGQNVYLDPITKGASA